MNNLAAAVDIGGSHVEYGIVQGDRLLASERIAVDDASLMAVLPHLERNIPAIAGRCGVPLDSLCGLAMGICALVDRSGMVVAANGKYSDAVRFDLKRWCKLTFGLPFEIENDARLALLGEHAAGAARGYDDVALVTVGTGVGGAVMLGGKLLQSRGQRAGSLAGHIGVDWNGRLCTCGNRGCAEAESSTVALDSVARAQKGFAASMLAGQPGRIDFKGLFAAVDAGDLFAEELLERCVTIWSALAVSLIHAYDPQVLVFGGGVMLRHEAILPRIRAHIAAHAWTGDDHVALVPSILGSSAALFGALPLLRRNA